MEGMGDVYHLHKEKLFTQNKAKQDHNVGVIIALPQAPVHKTHSLNLKCDAKTSKTQQRNLDSRAQSSFRSGLWTSFCASEKSDFLHEMSANFNGNGKKQMVITVR
ncbi:hypothetical protein PoB_003349400 [Plakobranchus ocellatus]|uniref:Uncharacterized protein n=1 Tax=Plakobranchus ocellatus TaxID=259542 RepID=A0AAV4AL79_9GAST|nr:hypothetical protein PoB_003349400 [Plakobranchus ocellatus]